jgi:hypothetical protein
MIGALRRTPERRGKTVEQIAVDERHCAQALGVSVSWLRKDRCDKRIVPYYKLGNRVVYNLDRVRDALKAVECGGQRTRSPAR